MNNIETSIFFILFIIHCLYSSHVSSPSIRHFIYKYLNIIGSVGNEIYLLLDAFFIRYNQLVYPDYWNGDMCGEMDSDGVKDGVIEREKEGESEKKVSKYEDKYIDIIRKLNKEWQFTEDELNEKNVIIESCYRDIIETNKREIEELQEQIRQLEKEMKEDNNETQYIETLNADGDELVEELTVEDRNQFRREQIEEYNQQINVISNQLNNEEGLENIRSNAIAIANKRLIDIRIQSLSNNYVMEKTPQGNVLMLYDKDRETFKYYSDSTVPYRYLEVVGRKYVKIFNCRPLFVDMEEELKIVEEKWTKDYELKKAKELAEEKAKMERSSNQPKKSVFAKFKSYNKEGGNGKISMAVPPKNSIPNKQIVETKENEKILLKEKANRYTYEGKFINFKFLQKIERKVFNKKLNMSFAEFKKMQYTGSKNL